MLAIKVKAENSTEAEIISLEEPTQDKPLWSILAEEIGCRFIEIVRTSVLKTSEPNQSVVIVCDEEFLLRHSVPVPNVIGSFLYKGLLCGDIIIMLEGFNDEGEMDLMGFDENPMVAFNLVHGILNGSELQPVLQKFGNDLAKVMAKEMGVDL